MHPQQHSQPSEPRRSWYARLSTFQQIFLSFSITLFVILLIAGGFVVAMRISQIGHEEIARQQMLADYEEGFRAGRQSYPAGSQEAAAALCKAASGLLYANGGQRITAAHARGCVDGATSADVPRLGPKGDYPY